MDFYETDRRANALSWHLRNILPFIPDVLLNVLHEYCTTTLRNEDFPPPKVSYNLSPCKQCAPYNLEHYIFSDQKGQMIMALPQVCQNCRTTEWSWEDIYILQKTQDETYILCVACIVNMGYHIHDPTKCGWNGAMEGKSCQNCIHMDMYRLCPLEVDYKLIGSLKTFNQELMCPYTNPNGRERNSSTKNTYRHEIADDHKVYCRLCTGKTKPKIRHYRGTLSQCEVCLQKFCHSCCQIQVHRKGQHLCLKCHSLSKRKAFAVKMKILDKDLQGFGIDTFRCI